MKIQPHTLNISYDQPHFFLQSRGYNAGRPSAKSYTHSYVILLNDEVEKGMIFWICFGLWKTNRFVPLLKGSTPSLLTIQDACSLIDSTCGKLSSHPGDFLSNVRELKDLIYTENLLTAQIKIIRQIKKSVAKKMLR